MFIDIHAHAYRNPQPVWDGKPLFSTPQQVLARFLMPFKDYPQRMPISSLSVDKVMEKLSAGRKD